MYFTKLIESIKNFTFEETITDSEKLADLTRMETEIMEQQFSLLSIEATVK